MDIFRKTFLAGLGAVSLSREKAKALVDEMVEQGKVREKEGRKLVEEMMKKASAARQDVEKAINQQVSSAYTKVNLATQDQLKKMERRIQQLEQALKKKVPSRKPRSSSKS